MSTLFLELSKQKKLLQLMEERGFTLCQQNGQRTYGGPPPNWGSRPAPSRDCEVFIGRIPRMCFEDELIPLFQSVGELYEFRLMLDFSGTNRGYGYAHYATLEGAMNAIKVLNKYEIRPGHYIGVLKSKNNCRLLFGNIKSGVSYETFNEFIRTVTSQVLNVFMFTSFDQLRITDLSISMEVQEAFLGRIPRNCVNSQFAIVEYETHKAAAVARRILIPRYGQILAIDWAVPPRERKRTFQGDSSMQSVSGRNKSVLPLRNGMGSGPNLKNRTVPVLVNRPSIFDYFPHMPKAFDNIVKYFKLLLSVSLHKSTQRGDIPPTVYLDLEKRIVDRITNLENCGQAVQLIFNYLSWFNDRKVMGMESEFEKVLQEVKIFSDAFVHFILSKMTCGKSVSSDLEDYYCNILPVQLNFIYRMTQVLTGEERAKLCGRISVSLQWFNEIIRRIRSGDARTKDFLMQISRLELGMEDVVVDKEELTNLMRPLSRAKTYSPAHYQSSQGCFSAASVPWLGSGIDKARSLSGSSSSSSGFQVVDEVASSDVSVVKDRLDEASQTGAECFAPFNITRDWPPAPLESILDVGSESKFMEQNMQI